MNGLTIIVGVIVGIAGILLVYTSWLDEQGRRKAQAIREARERHPATRWQKLRDEFKDVA